MIKNSTFKCFMKTPAGTGHCKERGIVLPVAMVMLVILSFAGLLAARNSATHEQFSNNLRTTNVARQAAEAALRYCERVAMEAGGAGEETSFAAEVAQIVSTELTNLTAETIQNNGAWNIKANWKDGATNLITVTLGHGSNVQNDAKIANDPTCIIQPANEDRYLITARGLSNDAETDSNGVLTSGSEVWLQSILTPGSPALSAAGGAEIPAAGS